MDLMSVFGKGKAKEESKPVESSLKLANEVSRIRLTNDIAFLINARTYDIEFETIIKEFQDFISSYEFNFEEIAYNLILKDFNIIQSTNLDFIIGYIEYPSDIFSEQQRRILSDNLQTIIRLLLEPTLEVLGDIKSELEKLLK